MWRRPQLGVRGEWARGGGAMWRGGSALSSTRLCPCCRPTMVFAGAPSRLYLRLVGRTHLLCRVPVVGWGVRSFPHPVVACFFSVAAYVRYTSQSPQPARPPRCPPLSLSLGIPESFHPRPRRAVRSSVTRRRCPSPPHLFQSTTAAHHVHDERRDVKGRPRGRKETEELRGSGPPLVLPACNGKEHSHDTPRAHSESLPSSPRPSVYGRCTAATAHRSAPAAQSCGRVLNCTVDSTRLSTSKSDDQERPA